MGDLLRLCPALFIYQEATKDLQVQYSTHTIHTDYVNTVYYYILTYMYHVYCAWGICMNIDRVH